MPIEEHVKTILSTETTKAQDKKATAAILRNPTKEVMRKLIIDGLNYDNWTISDRAEELLVKIGRKAVPELIKYGLTYDDNDVNQRTARVLGDIGDKRAIRHLFEKGLGDMYHAGLYGSTIGKIGGEKAYKLAIQGLDSVNRNYVKLGIYALAKLKDERAVPHIIKKVLKKYDGSSSNRHLNECILALGNIGGDKATKAIAKYGLTINDDDIAYNAVDQLQKMKTNYAYNELIKYGLTSENEKIVVWSMQVLKEGYPIEAMGAMVKHALGHHSDYVVKATAQEMGTITKETIDVLADKGLNHKNPVAVMASIQELKKFGKPMLPKFMKITGHYSTQVRDTAKEAIAEIQKKEKENAV